MNSLPQNVLDDLARSGLTAADAKRMGDRLYAALQAGGRDVLYDDSDERVGVKLATMDLIGIPWQLVVGPRGLANGVVELKRRATGERVELSPEAALAKLGGVA